MSLQNVCSSLEAEVSRYSQRLFTSDDLESIELGIRELKFSAIQLEKLQLRMAKVIELPLNNSLNPL